jgi:hypothetical protein
VKLFALAAVLVALAFPAVSIAGPGHPVRPAPAAPTLASHLPALGTDVASPDQQQPAAPAPPAADESAFAWSDVGLGAGGAIAVLAASLAIALTLRRRRTLPG